MLTVMSICPQTAMKVQLEVQIKAGQGYQEDPSPAPSAF